MNKLLIVKQKSQILTDRMFVSLAIFLLIGFAGCTDDNDAGNLNSPANKISPLTSLDSSIVNGYWYQGKYLEFGTFQPDTFFVCPSHASSEEQFEFWLDKKDFTMKIPCGVGYLVKSSVIPHESGIYSSKLYRSSLWDEWVVLLPSLNICLKAECPIDSVIEKYRLFLNQERNIGRVYTFHCNISTSDELLNLVAMIQGEETVEWCEPCLCRDAWLNEPYDGIGGTWSMVQANYALSGILHYQIGEILYTFNDEGSLTVEDNCQAPHHLKESGLYSYTFDPEKWTLIIGDETYKCHITNGLLVIDEGSRADRPSYILVKMNY